MHQLRLSASLIFYPEKKLIGESENFDHAEINNLLCKKKFENLL